MGSGFMYLHAIIDVYSRFIVGWRLSNDLSASNCITLLEECISRYGAPEIVNTDQGCQYTSEDWIGCLKEHHIRISMDGRGRALDNIFIERLWRSVKYECIYLNAFENGARLYYGLDEYFRFYNTERKHQSLDNQTPDSVYKKIA